MKKILKIAVVTAIVCVYCMVFIACEKKVANSTVAQPKKDTVVATASDTLNKELESNNVNENDQVNKQPSSISQDSKANTEKQTSSDKNTQQVAQPSIQQSNDVQASNTQGNSTQISSQGRTLKGATSQNDGKIVDESPKIDSYLKTIESNPNIIRPEYGSHTYGCKNVSEYTAVMQQVKAAVANKDSITLDPYIARYENGDRASNYSDTNSDDYRGLKGVQKTSGDFLDNTDKKYHSDALKGGPISYNFTSKESTNSDANSAFDVIVKKQGKCQADAQVDSAIYDVMGFSTTVIGDQGDAKCYVKISGQWWTAGALTLANLNSGGIVISGPTY